LQEKAELVGGMNRILSPVSSREEIEPLVKAGADEFFLGYIPSFRLEESNAYLYLNRRATPGANFTRIEDVHETLEKAASLDKPVFITFNEHFYSDVLYHEISDILSSLNLGSPNGVIVSDIGLISILRRDFPGIALVASTGCPIFNSRTVSFYKSMGIERITLSVALTSEEIKLLATASREIGMDVECFIKNENCINTNALCTYIHGWHEDLVNKSFCKVEKGYKASGRQADNDKIAVERLDSLGTIISEGCGACFLPHFLDSGVQTFKIDGRTRKTTEKARDIFFIRKLLQILEQERPVKEEFEEEAMRIFRKIYGKACEKRCIYS